jgi:spore coat protein U-like protein
MPVNNFRSRTLWSLLWLLPLVTTLQVSAPAAAGCDAVVSLVDFGQLDLDDGAEVTGELVVNCDEPGAFSIGLSQGIGDFTRRRMRGFDGAELRYNLFVDPGRKRIWGDGVSAGTQTIKGESDGRRPSIIPIYGIVPSRQSVLTGPYSDNLLVTVERL